MQFIETLLQTGEPLTSKLQVNWLLGKILIRFSFVTIRNECRFESGRFFATLTQVQIQNLIHGRFLTTFFDYVLRSFLDYIFRSFLDYVLRSGDEFLGSSYVSLFCIAIHSLVSDPWSDHPAHQFCLPVDEIKRSEVLFPCR